MDKSAIEFDPDDDYNVGYSEGYRAGEKSALQREEMIMAALRHRDTLLSDKNRELVQLRAILTEREAELADANRVVSHLSAKLARLECAPQIISK